jgi:hypothetical protein
MARLSEQFTMNNTCIAPQTLSNSTASSIGMSMATHRRFVYNCYAGSIPSSGALAWKLQQSDAVGGTYHDISGKTASHTDAEDGNIKTIEINSSELTVLPGHPFVRVFVTESGTQTCYIEASLIMEKDY